MIRGILPLCLDCTRFKGKCLSRGKNAGIACKVFVQPQTQPLTAKTKGRKQQDRQFDKMVSSIQPIFLPSLIYYSCVCFQHCCLCFPCIIALSLYNEPARKILVGFQGKAGKAFLCSLCNRLFGHFLGRSWDPRPSYPTSKGSVPNWTSPISGFIWDLSPNR